MSTPMTLLTVLQLCTKTTGSYNRHWTTSVGNGSKIFDPNVDHLVIQTGLVEYIYVCDSLY